MKKKRIFWIAAGMILLAGFVLWVIFLRPTRPVVSVAERMAAGEEDTRTLIVVYSHSGNTRRVAQLLQGLTGGDLLEVNTRRDYAVGMAVMAVQTRIERAVGLLPSLDVELPDIDRYDRILIGGPVWSYTVATPLSRFLSDMDFTGKQVAPFWTDAGSPGDYESSFASQVRGGEVLAGLGLSGSSRLSDEEVTQRLEEWLNTLQADYVNPGRSLEKYAYVYLPHGFNATDPETQYDVLYLLHGGGGNAERYFDGAGQSSQFKRILDHMIQNGELKPMIVVTPTFYPIGNTDSSVSTVGAAVAHFSEELVNDLIPAVESSYPTYAETTDASGLKASRDHRGFGGFSMGSVAAWYVFADCLDYFRYFLPMSGDCWIAGERAGGSDPAGTAAALANALKESGYGANDFFIHAMTGTSDMAYDALASQIEAMKEAEGFAFGADTSENNLYFSVLEGGTHDYGSIRRYLYNAMPAFLGAEDFDSAAEKAIKELETRLRDLFQQLKPSAGIPTKAGDIIGALLGDNDIFHFCDTSTISGKDQRRGIKSLFDGEFAAYRNPAAHANLSCTKREAIEQIMLASQLMYILDRPCLKS